MQLTGHWNKKSPKSKKKIFSFISEKYNSQNGIRKST
jgi:hypothetical protein